MSKLLETIDAETEYQMRLELREVLRKAYVALSKTNANEELLIEIEQTLEDTAP